MVGLCTGSSDAPARTNFVSELPNGTRIDGRGCINCHLDADGGGITNDFAWDHVKNGNSFAAICDIDSDQDGQSNGQELGDPDCVWVGGAPARAASARVAPDEETAQPRVIHLTMAGRALRTCGKKAGEHRRAELALDHVNRTTQGGEPAGFRILRRHRHGDARLPLT